MRPPVKSQDSSHTSSRQHRTLNGEGSAFFEGIQTKNDPLSDRQADDGSFFESAFIHTPVIQRCTGCDGKDDDGGGPEIQTKPAFNSDPEMGLQTKLKIGRPGDKYEREADAMAEQVVEQQAVRTLPAGSFTSGPTAVQSKCAKCQAEEAGKNEDQSPETDEIQTKSLDGPDLQPKCAKCGGDLEASTEEIQTQSRDGEIASAEPSLAGKLNDNKGKGTPLDGHVQNQMESSFQADFGGVKIHNDAESHQLNQELGAQAFTHGNDVYFGAEKYDPSSTAGSKLLAHELTHTIQQGASPGKDSISRKEEAEDLQRKASCESEQKGAESKECGVEPEVETNCSESEPKSEEAPKDAQPNDGEMTFGGITKEIVACLNPQKPPVEGTAPGCEINEAKEKPPEPEKPGLCEILDTQKQSRNKKAPPAPENNKGNKPEGTSMPGLAVDTEELDGIGLGEAASPEIQKERDEQLAQASFANEELTGILAAVNSLNQHKISFQAGDKAPGEVRENETKATEFVRHRGGKLAQMIAGTVSLADTIAQDAQKKKEATLANGEKLYQETNKRYEDHKQAVRDQASASITKVTNDYNEAVASINLGAGFANLILLFQFISNNLLLEAARKKQIAQVHKDYDKGYADIENVGIYYGCQARSKADEQAQLYRVADGASETTKRRVTRPKKDSYLKGYYTRNRYRARANAAEEVGRQFQKSMREESRNSADQFMCRKKGDLEFVDILAGEGRTNLGCGYELGLITIEDQRQENLNQVKEVYNKAVSDIRKTRRTTLAQLRLKQLVQAPFIRDYAVRQAMGHERTGQQARASLFEGVIGVITMLYEQLLQFVIQNKNREAPEREAFDNELKAHTLSFATAEETTQRVVRQTSDKVVQQLAENEAQGTADLTMLDKKDDREATEITETTVESIKGISRQTKTSYSEMLTEYWKSVFASVEEYSTILTSIVTTITGVYEKTNLELQKSIESQMNGLARGMIKQNDHALIPKIKCEAEKAADKVEPAWKSVLKIIIVILVVIIISVATAGALSVLATAAGVGAAAAGAAAIAAKIVIAAVVGVVGSLAGSVTSNKLNGRPAFEGVTFKTVAFDALLSVASLGFNKVGAAIFKGLKRTQKVATAGFEALADLGATFTVEKIKGNEFSLTDQLQGMAIGGFLARRVSKIGGKAGNKTDGGSAKKVKSRKSKGDADVAVAGPATSKSTKSRKSKGDANVPVEAPGTSKSVKSPKSKSVTDVSEDGPATPKSKEGVETGSGTSAGSKKKGEIADPGVKGEGPDKTPVAPPKTGLPEGDVPPVTKFNESLEKSHHEIQEKFGDQAPEVVSDLKKIGPVSDETLHRLVNDPELRRFLADNPDLVPILKKCASDCFLNITKTQAERFRTILIRAQKAGIPIDKAKLHDYLTNKKTPLKDALDSIDENDPKKLREIFEEINKLGHPGSNTVTKPDPNWKSTKTNKKKTGDNSKILSKNMEIKKGSGEEAHHIVASTHRKAAKARKILNDYQIDINDPANGVALKGGSGKSQKHLPRRHHGSELHSWAKSKEGGAIGKIQVRLEKAIKGKDWATARKAILSELKQIKIEIITGKFP